MYQNNSDIGPTFDLLRRPVTFTNARTCQKGCLGGDWTIGSISWQDMSEGAGHHDNMLIMSKFEWVLEPAYPFLICDSKWDSLPHLMAVEWQC